MNDEIICEIKEKLLEIANLAYTLKVALDNTEQPTTDTIPYSRVIGMIEHKIYKIIEIVED